MSAVLAIDQGTTSSRAMVFTASGEVRSEARAEQRQHYPRAGWVEHDAAEIWAGQTTAARHALLQAGVAARDLLAIGIANQRETTVLWDRRTGEPVHHALVWQDRRTAPDCERLIAAGLTPLIRQRTGLLPDPYFSATKLRWLLDHVPDARRRARDGELAFGTIDSWLIHRMTAGRRHITDVSNASRTMLMDIHRCRWDDDLLRHFDIPAVVLPEIVDSSGELGVTSPDWLGVEVPIRGIAGDQQAALFGQDCTEKGMAKCTYGTGCFFLGHAGEKPGETAGGLPTILAWRHPHQPPAYAVEGAIFCGGAAVQFLRDALGLIHQSHEVEALALSVPDSDGVTFVPALTGLGAPHWNPNVRGILSGLTRGTTAAHIARAALDAIAHQVVDVCEEMSRLVSPVRELRVDGGASRNDLLMQTQADLLGVPVIRTGRAEATAWGAARLALIASGHPPASDDLSQTATRFEPRASPALVRARRESWKHEIARCGFVPSPGGKS